MSAVTRLGPGGTPIAAAGPSGPPAEIFATLAATEVADTASFTALLSLTGIEEVVLPSRVVTESSGSILTDTVIVTRARGIETRRARVVVPYERFTLKFHAGQAPLVEDLFRTELGPVRQFLFDHLDDNVATEVELEKITVGGVTTAQVRQAYESRSVYTDAVIRTVYQPLYRFKTDTLVVTVDDVPVTEGVDFTESDGLLIFNEIVSGTIKASCGFYKVVRFEDDQLELVWGDFDQRKIASCRVYSLIYPQLPFEAI